MVDHGVETRIDYFCSSIFNVKYDLAQNILSHEFPTSLEHIAVMRIALILWQCDDIRDDFAATIASGFSVERFLRQNLPPIPRILKKVSSLFLPKFCEEVVKQMIKIIGIQIFKYLTFHNQFGSSVIKNIKLYWDNICWTQQGTINNLKSAMSLVECTNLSIKEKYIIGCNNCLEKEINGLLKQLPAKVIKEFAEDETYRLVMFWTCRLINEEEKFSVFIRQEQGTEVINNNKYIFEWAVRNMNEVAVEYIWTHFADEEIKVHLMSVARDAMGRAKFTDYMRFINISCYLLSQMNQSQIEEICTKKGYILLELLLDDRGRWQHFLFPTTKYITQYLVKMDISDALEIVNLCWKENVFKREHYLNVLSDFLIIFGNEVKKDFVKICIKFLNSLLSRKDVDIIKSFLSNGLAQDKKKIMYDAFGMKFCEQLIITGKLDLLNVLIREMLLTEQEIRKFKRYFFEESRFKICFDLVMKDSYKVLDTFLSMFCLEEETRNLKYKLPYVENAKIVVYILKWTAKKDTLQLTRIDKFLNWCFESNEENIIQCKKVIFDPENGEYSDCNDRILKRVSVLIKEGEWHLVDEYMNWTYITKDKVLIFKKNLANKKEISLKLMHDLILRGDNLRSFMKFVNFLIQSDVEKLKVEMKISNKLVSVVRELQRRHKSTDVNDLLQWWFHSPEAIAKFKRKV